MAQITIDARKYFDFGIGTYIRHLIEGLARLRLGHSFCILVSPNDAARIVPPKGWEVRTIPFGKYSLGEFFLMGRAVEIEGGSSIFHSPHYTLPRGLGGRAVVTIHDVIPLRMPQLFSWIQRLYAYAMVGYAVRNAQFVLTDSEFTRRDILRLFRVREEKVVAIHLGIPPQFRVLPKAARQKFRALKGLTRRYVLFAGNPKPHKGIPTLMRAFVRIAPLFPDLDLVFVGGASPQNSAVRELAHAYGIEGRVKELGQISEEELISCYNCAEILVMPSLYEGFGLPALEAMACGAAVVVSDAASLPEIVGDAALTFQAGNPDSLAESMDSLLRNEALRSAMVKRGLSHVRRFSWKTTAEKTMSVYEKVLSGEKRT